MTLQFQKPRLAIDMDEVIADAHPFQAAWFGKNFGYHWTPEQINSGSLHSFVATEHAASMDAALHEGKIFEAFSPMHGSQDDSAEQLKKWKRAQLKLTGRVS